MGKKVWILPGDSWGSAVEMFKRHGWFNEGLPEQKPDLICFLGGTDVDPSVYGAERHPMTQSPDKARDAFEVEVFNQFKDIPKVGICRGGQLLNVLNGGEMIQHLGETVSGDVPCLSILDGKNLIMRVDHHQGMQGIPSRFVVKSTNQGVIDYAGYYPETKSLCFQPHPEWSHKETEDYFFEFLSQCFEDLE